MSRTQPAKPAIEAIARGIIRGLRARRDPVRAQGVQQYFKHEIVALGITTHELREFCRAQVKRLKPAWGVRAAVALCDRLLQEREMEIRGAGLLVLGGFKREFAPDLLPWARRWLQENLDNWALVDGFCGTVLSPLMAQHPEVVDPLIVWSRAESLWLRRASLVTLVPFARRGQRLDTAYRLAGEHFADSEDLMHKATGWLLREAGKTDMDRLRGFLLDHGPAIPRTSLRYAIERFPAAERARLLKLTRAALPKRNRLQS